MNRLFSAITITLLMSATYLLVFPGSVSAHERRNVSKYEFMVGFIVEPPFEGQKNGVDFRVTDTETKKPVEGAEKTVQVEITHVPSGVSGTFKLRTIFRDPGHYTSDLIPTAPGQYQFRFFGNIEGTPVNETFVSGPGRFNDVGAAAELQFPQKLPEFREVTGAVKGAQTSAQEARDMASSSRALAYAGIVLGALGIILGIGSVVMVARRR